jgi:CubicO group peptidase (beta-lactamase class C family)
MKNKFIISIILVLVLSSTVLFNGCKQGSEQEQTLAEKIDAIVNPNVKVGVMVGIFLNGQRRVFSYGSKTRNGNDPPDGDTVFEIGSITKTFTCTMLAEMVLNGLIDLDDAVGGYLPADKVTLPTFNGAELTFLHLATHSSGLPRMPDNFDDAVTDPADPFAAYTEDHMFAFLNGHTLEFTPGVQCMYSNLGMGLLGLTLCKINGASYEILLQEKIFNRLGMTNSSLFLTDQQRSNMATGHNEGLQPVSMWTAADCFQGAGFIKSSVNDMFKYLEANLGVSDTALSAAILLAHETAADIDCGEGIGLGWFYDQLGDGQVIIWHNGGTGGQSAYFGFNKSLSTGVIILCNTSHDGSPDSMGERILMLLKDYVN